jgi:hypothetical protein
LASQRIKASIFDTRTVHRRREENEHFVFSALYSYIIMVILYQAGLFYYRYVGITLGLFGHFASREREEREVKEGE